MKLKKHLRLLLSLLVMSVFLLTGCSPEVEELAADMLTAIAESEYEEAAQELPQEETDLTIPEETSTEETTVPEKTTDTQETSSEETPDISTGEPAAEENEIPAEEEKAVIDENGTYTSKEEVAAYIHEYGHLPSNFITKKEAKKLGWVSSEGNLDEAAPGMSIGGDYFGNYEGNLPEEKGRDYYECDIDFDGTYRNAKRIVFSNDGLIYYTEDHYETFELLYGEE